MSAALPRSMVELLVRVRRGLWLARGSRLARFAGCIACAVALAAGLWHLTVAQLTSHVLLGLPALSIAAGIALALVRRPQLSECARWADRNLDGRTAYTTLLALARESHAQPSPAATAHLVAWTERAATAGLRRYAERPAAHVVSQSVLLTALAATFATAFLALPGREARGSAAVAPGDALHALTDVDTNRSVTTATPASRLRSAAAAAHDARWLPAQTSAERGAGDSPDPRQDGIDGPDPPQVGDPQIRQGPSGNSAGADDAVQREPGSAARADRPSPAAPPQSSNALEGTTYGIARSDDPRARRATQESSGAYAPFVESGTPSPPPHFKVPAAIHAPETLHAYTAAERRLVEQYLVAIGARP